LEIFVVNDVIEGWQAQRQKTEITPEEMTTVTIYYAENDAWPIENDG
jgi:hypothetical protein